MIIYKQNKAKKMFVYYINIKEIINTASKLFVTFVSGY